MVKVALAIIIHKGRILVEQLQESIRPDFRGVPAVLPGGRIRSDEPEEVAVVREVAWDTGLSIVVNWKIAEREHPLLPGSHISYFACSLEGTSEIAGKNRKKVTSASWVDIPTASVLMLTLFTKVLHFIIKEIYGNTLAQGENLPRLSWLQQDFLKFGEKIRRGELVAFPTETVYGLGANAFDTNAVGSIFKAKQRPADNPLIVHVPAIEKLEQVVQQIDILTERMLKEFSPGPMTFLLPKSPGIPAIVTAGSHLVGVRIPSHQFALEFLAAAQVPIAAPSANKSGKPSATHHEHVIEAFGKEVPNVIKAGNTFHGIESTVVMPKNNEEIYILRQGAVSEEMIRHAFPTYNIIIARKDDANIKASPGTRYRHYAPNAVMQVLPLVPKKKAVELIENLHRKYQHKRILVLCSQELSTYLPEKFQRTVFGTEKDKVSLLKNFYRTLLECDKRNVEVIVIQSFNKKGHGSTLMERINRAAGVQ